MLSRIVGWAVAAAFAAATAAFLYAAIFRAKDWTNPKAARGAGFGVLGLLVVGAGVWVDSAALKWTGGALALAGFVWAAAGLAD